MRGNGLNFNDFFNDLKKRKSVIIGAVLIAVFILSVTYNTFSVDFPSLMTQTTAKKQYRTVIIDAGHGGEDGGAVGVDGVVEKDLNLPIALKTAELLKKAGVDVLLTRDDDYAVYSDEAKSIREKKVSDIHNRFSMIEDTGNCIFVSIHMNHYDSESCHGAQTFYSKNNPESHELAQFIQSSIKDSVQPDNERQIKESTNSIFLLYYAEVPAVLVECGFISNREESEKLKDKDYQNKMAQSVCKGVLEFLEGE